MTVVAGITQRSSLVEREDELNELTATLDAGRRGNGSLVVIAGAAGTGKSSLLAAAADHARRRRLTVVRARGSELEQKLSFGVIRRLFDPLMQSGSAAERKQLLSGAAAAVARLFEDA